MIGNAEKCVRIFPSSQRFAEEGWTRHRIKMDTFRNGAAGMVSSAKLFRPEHLAELTTITASRYRSRASRPSAASSVASRRLLMPQSRPRWLVSLHDGDCPPLCDRLVSQHRQDSRPLQSCQYFSSFTLSRGSSESS